MKDIVTKYAASGSKVKNLKKNAYLIKDPIIRKIMAKVATYKQKNEFGVISFRRFYWFSQLQNYQTNKGLL